MSRVRWENASSTASVAFTLDVYSHAIQGLDDDAAIRVADLIHKGTHVQRRP
jgi:hypothetical protein